MNAPQTTLDRGLVNVYLRNPEGLIFQLNYATAGGNYTHYYLTLGVITIRSNYSATYPYRYVIIPSSISGGGFTTGPAVGYSVDQVKGMSYEQVVTLLEFQQKALISKNSL